MKCEFYKIRWYSFSLVEPHIIIQLLKSILPVICLAFLPSFQTVCSLTKNKHTIKTLFTIRNVLPDCKQYLKLNWKCCTNMQILNYNLFIWIPQAKLQFYLLLCLFISLKVKVWKQKSCGMSCKLKQYAYTSLPVLKSLCPFAFLFNSIRTYLEKNSETNTLL